MNDASNTAFLLPCAGFNHMCALALKTATAVLLLAFPVGAILQVRRLRAARRGRRRCVNTLQRYSNARR
ncbi:MAG: hypothetical protein ABI171_06100 [Collimonas sp.]|uniref:hypothetical protein n=1 Tax=Collimonas sp. TaxID=1963772 RepID=UPI0032638FAB